MSNQQNELRAVIYIRVSSASQIEGFSLDAQERLCKEYCLKNGFALINIYRDEGKSAHVDSFANRPAFCKLLDDSKKNMFDLVVVHTVDRWARNMRIMLMTTHDLDQNHVKLVSVNENLDRSTPDGSLNVNIRGMFAQYYSDSISIHVRKSFDQRAKEGKHVGGIPFGYESCWIEENGERKRRCNPEHPGGLHPHPGESPAITDLFRLYASGTTTLGQLAVWLNEQGLRTHNTKNLPNSKGELSSGPRLFTSASVRWILHNPFYTGEVPYRGQLITGAHDPLVSPEFFNLVQATLKKNSGRSETLKVKPEREYLMKGIIRCAYCGMPMWAQTYKNGHPYYREHNHSRSLESCPSTGSSIPCHIADNQIGQLIEAIELKTKWQEEVLAILNLKDEVARIIKERQAIQEKMRRMARAYMDGLFPDEDYNRQKRLMEMQIESLIIPEVNATKEAGELIHNLPGLWQEANLSEKRKIILTMLDAVYIDAKKTKSIVAIKPKPPFRPIFQVAVSKKNADIRIINEPLQGSSVFLVETGEG